MKSQSSHAFIFFFFTIFYFVRLAILKLYLAEIILTVLGKLIKFQTKITHENQVQKK